MSKSKLLYLVLLLSFCTCLTFVVQGAPLDVGIIGISVENLEPTLRQWAAENNIEIGVIENIGWNSGKVINRALAGIPYDVVCAVIEEAKVLVNHGLLLPLNDLIAAEPEFAEDLYEDIHPSVMAMFNFKGNQFYIPSEWNLCIMYYNTAMFEQAAIDYPDSDWEIAQFQSCARKLSCDIDGDGTNDEYGYGAFGWNPWEIGPWINTFGGAILDETWTASRMSRPETINALEFIQGMLEEGSMPPISIQWDYLPEHNKCAMWLAGHGPMGIYRNLNWTDYDIQHMPACNKNRGTALGGAGYGISVNTKDREAAWKVLKFLTGKAIRDEMQAQNMDIGAFPPRKSVGFYELAPNIPPKNAIAFYEALDYATTVPSPVQYPEVDGVVREYLGIIWRGEDSVSNVALQMHDLINSILSGN
ncbi:MAG: extracellular solute-binding protein [Limnochordia bacterium]|jgi:multiple sugar transport system substrate-binding protein